MKHLLLFLCASGFTLLSYGQQVKVPDNYSQVNTLQQMLAPFKGKPVLVDLWATWCYACLDEFKYNDQLDAYLDKNHIALLYVSFDEDKLDSTWRKNIIALKLNGYHIRAGKPLLNAITTLVWGAPGGFSIPRYLLFDGKGNVLSKDLSPPGTTIQLYDQLERLLK